MILHVGKVIHTSTSEVYGTARFVPITEEHPLQAQSPYSASKIGADQLAMSFHSSFGTPVVIVRPFNTYGPRQSARAVIPTIITQIASGVRQDQARRAASDARFHLCGGQRDCISGGRTSKVGERCGRGNQPSGSNFCYPIGDTARQIAEVMGAEIEIVADEQRLRPEKSEVERLCGASNEKSPSIAELAAELWRFGGICRRGLTQTVEWFLASPAT